MYQHAIIVKNGGWHDNDAREIQKIKERSISTATISMSRHAIKPSSPNLKKGSYDNYKSHTKRTKKIKEACSLNTAIKPANPNIQLNKYLDDVSQLHLLPLVCGVKTNTITDLTASHQNNIPHNGKINCNGWLNRCARINRAQNQQVLKRLGGSAPVTSNRCASG